MQLLRGSMASEPDRTQTYIKKDLGVAQNVLVRSGFADIYSSHDGSIS